MIFVDFNSNNALLWYLIALICLQIYKVYRVQPKTKGAKFKI